MYICVRYSGELEYVYLCTLYSGELEYVYLCTLLCRIRICMYEYERGEILLMIIPPPMNGRLNWQKES